MRLKVLIVSILFMLTMSASTVTDAEKFYRAEDWAKAATLYAKLLKSSPSNRVYNHRYGVCLYEQEKDLSIAEKHLLRSKKSGISLSAFYLGRVCFLQYKFAEAMGYYNYYLSKSTDKNKKQAIQGYLEKCEHGSELLSRVEDVNILDKVEVDKATFFLHYDVSNEIGTFLTDATDIGEDSIVDNTTIYLTERGDRAFFSLAEEDGNFNLYSKNRLLDQWAEKISLGENVNTPEDEAYSFLMPDGVGLYFSSKGHHSFGGYDIYVTRYNASQNSYLPPQQLGMPFNSIGDDILIAIDEYNNVGWFASDRNNEEGRITIYTFEPNATFKLLDTESEQERIAAALISYTMNTTVDSSAVEQAPVIARQVKEDVRNIYFVVNDTLIYTAIDDFMSEDAQSSFLEYETAAARYDSTAMAVSEKRLLYSRASDSNEKAKLISGIISLEQQSFESEEQRDELLLSTRRIELETIKTNGGYLKEKPTKVEAPVAPIAIEETHSSPWEAEVPTLKRGKVVRPFFYNETLYAYYEQIFSNEAVEKLIEANQMKVTAGNKLFLSDYVMREYSKPVPEETFFEKIFSYDTTLSPHLTSAQIMAKVTTISDAGALLFVESNYLSFYTLKGQNVLLLETVKDLAYRDELQGLMDRAAFSFQQANQKIYIADNAYSSNKESLAQGNNLLKEAIQFLEAASLTYLKYRYEAQQSPRANKPMPEGALIEILEDVDSVEVEFSSIDTVVRTEIAPKAITKPSTSVVSEEYRIQFGIFSRLLVEADVKLTALSYYKYSEKELYKYYTGHFTSSMEAAMGLEEIKAKGFKDAFVVKFVDGVPE